MFLGCIPWVELPGHLLTASGLRNHQTGFHSASYLICTPATVREGSCGACVDFLTRVLAQFCILLCPSIPCKCPLVMHSPCGHQKKKSTCLSLSKSYSLIHYWKKNLGKCRKKNVIATLPMGWPLTVVAKAVTPVGPCPCDIFTLPPPPTHTQG